MTYFHLQHFSQWYSQKSIVKVALWTIAYAGIATFLLNYFAGAAGASPIWLPAGIGLGILLVFGLRYWPFIFIGATLGEMGGGHHLFMAAQLAAGSVLSFTFVAMLLKRHLQFNINLETLGDYARLLIVSLIGAFISTTINIQFLTWAELLPQAGLLSIYQHWFIGDFFGMAFITPIVLVAHQPWLSVWPKKKVAFFLLAFFATFIFGQAVFLGWFKDLVDLSGRGFFFLFIATLFGYHFGRHGALAVFALVVVQSVLGALYGDGYFDKNMMSHPGQQVIWFYLAVICAVGILVSLVVRNFRRQNQALIDASRIAFEAALHFKSIISEVPVLMVTYDTAKEKTDYVNPFFTQVLGYTIEDFVDSGSWWLFAYPDPQYRASVQTEWNLRMERSERSSTPFEPLETLTTCKDGSQRSIGWGCFAVDRRLVIYGQDLTEKNKASKVLETTSALYRAIGEAVVISDAKNKLLMANEAFQVLSGYRDDELINHDFADFLIKKHGIHSNSDIFGSLDAVGHWEGQSWLKTKGGKELLKFVSIHSTFDGEGIPLQRVALISEVTDQRRARELINQQANFDALTGLPNRRLMLDRLEQVIKYATRAQKSLAVIYIDLDNFKNANDSRGHDFGDELLKQVASQLRVKVRDTDTVSRIGGDEFVVILGELDRPESADFIVREIMNQLVEPILIQSQLTYVTASFGVAMFPNDGKNGKDLLLAADQAMYAAKESGRNCYQYFTPNLQVKAKYRSGVMAELRTALEQHQFFLNYQPIVDLQTGKILHAEALLRWRKPNGEIVMPGAFIEIAEESGLIVEIGDWVFLEALKFVKSLGEGPQISIALNVSAAQFNSSEHSALRWIESIKESGVSPESLVLEITERMMLIQSQRVLRKIAMLQEIGCKFSVDDFGTGYSSLATLKSHNFDYIKIDAHFIQNLRLGSPDLPLVEAMISMARSMNLLSVAEGVETREQADVLRAMGCKLAQGYLFSKPLSPEEFRNLLT